MLVVTVEAVHSVTGAYDDRVERLAMLEIAEMSSVGQNIAGDSQCLTGGGVAVH